MERVCSDERLFVNAWANWADCLLSSAVREAKALACLIRSVDCLSNAVVRDAVSVVCSRAFCDVSVGCSGCFETVGRAAFFSFCSSAVEGGSAGEVGAIAFPPFVPVAEEEDVCCTADNLWGLSPLFGEYGCSVSAVSVSTDCRTGRSVKEKQTVRSAVSGNASKILNFDRRFCWLCRMRTPSTDASVLAGCATFQTLKPQASLHPLQDENTAYWRCWDARKQNTRCNEAGGRLSAGSYKSIGF